TRLRTRSPRSRTACTPRTGQHPRSYPPILRTSRARQAPSLEYSTLMNLGYDGKLYILAFDHRGSFQKKFFGIEGEPDPRRSDAWRRRSSPSVRGRVRPRCRRTSSGMTRGGRTRGCRASRRSLVSSLEYFKGVWAG